MVRAWYASIDYSDRALTARAILPDAPAARESTSALAAKANALVAVNGGYFSWAAPGASASSLSLVLSQGRLLSPGATSASRPNGKHFLTRGAFGVRFDRSFDVTWAATLPRENNLGKYLWSYPTPVPNLYSAPAPPFSREFPAGGQEWNVTEAIGGAPVLLEGGEPKITAEAEAIGPEMVKVRHPRTLIGWAGGNKMLLLVCDGRRPDWSMGLTLEESALLMRDLGCVEALNLDGGGSSTFVAAGKVLNKPSDGSERRVSSIWAITKTLPLP
jgi:exopolysaccharide biosynthesis protein